MERRARLISARGCRGAAREQTVNRYDHACPHAIAHPKVQANRGSAAAGAAIVANGAVVDGTDRRDELDLVEVTAEDPGQPEPGREGEDAERRLRLRRS